jgi:hypothetical protein
MPGVLPNFHDLEVSARAVPAEDLVRDEARTRTDLADVTRNFSGESRP